MTDSYSYRAFGEEEAAGSGTVNPARYVGAFGYQRDVADRLYVRARVLKPAAGRWASRDPIGLAAGDLDLYAYGRKNPATYVDPTGLWGQSVHSGCTFQRAREACEAGPDGLLYVFDTRMPADMATACQAMDNIGNSAVFVDNRPFHFNYADSRDRAKVINGQALADSPNTREVVFEGARAVALLSEGLGCLSKAWLFGSVLHGIEDIGAHDGLTPAEHREKRNDQGNTVDLIDWDMGPVQIAHVPLMADKLGVDNFFRDYAHGKTVFVRVFKWQHGNTRILATEARVRKEMSSFLKELIKRKKCLKSVCKCPPKGPACPPRNQDL